MLVKDAVYVTDELWDAHMKLSEAYKQIRALLQDACQGDHDLGRMSADILVIMGDILSKIDEVNNYEISNFPRES